VNQSPVPVRRRVEQIMGLPISLGLRGRHADDEYGHAAWDRAVASLHEADRVFSTYRPDSFISRLGRGELDLADCPPEVAEVLALGEQARADSGGAFDVRRLGPDGRRLLDPSGVVKGWAVQRAMAAFNDLDETDVCLSAGGDMECRVSDPAGAPWHIGIEDPHNPQRLIARVPLRNGALATSGAAHRGAHIVNAVTNEVPRLVASVTVVAESLTWADIDATAAYAQDGQALIWLQTRPGRSGLVVWRDGRTDSFAIPA
jgi:FAD:protein FMN transferase